MKFQILTLFPEAVQPYVQTSILQRAQAEKLIEVAVTNLRDFADDKHQTVDDTPYGGGAGMVMKIEPIHRALQSIGQKKKNEKRKTVVLSARGKQFTQQKAEEYAKLDQLILICGRYEGIDQRVADHLADEELSIGPYVLAGGEIAALAVLEASARLKPGVLGNPASLIEESFNSSNKLMKLEANEATIEYPQYTKPTEYQGWEVPEVLLSGDHEAIKTWREGQQRGTVSL